MGVFLKLLEFEEKKYSMGRSFEFVTKKLIKKSIKIKAFLLEIQVNDNI